MISSVKLCSDTQGPLLPAGATGTAHLVVLARQTWEDLVTSPGDASRADLLRALLTLLRGLFCREDEGRALSLQGQPLAQGLLDAGCLEAVLSLLRGLAGEPATSALYPLKTDVLAGTAVQ